MKSDDRAKVFKAVSDFSLIEVRPLPPVAPWAEENRMMPGSVTAKPGMYSLERTPYMRAVMDAFDDPEVQIVVTCMAKRMGKTEAQLNLIGRTIDGDPCNILVMYPNIDDVKKFFSQSVQIMLESCPALKGKVTSPLKRDGSNTARVKKYPGGQLTGIGSNSPSALRGVQARIVIGEEIDSMEPGREGDPVDLLLARAENYPNAIQVLNSTPTNTGTSRIWDWLEKSDFQKWHVKSPRTGKWHVLDWANVKWEGGDPATAHYVDPDTGELWTEQERLEAIASGDWRATQPFNGIRGFWLDGLNSLFPPKRGFDSKPHQWATEFLQAKHGGPDSLKVWTNTFRALCWEELAESVEWELVQERAETYEVHPLPERVLLLTLAADVQGDRIELEWVGWGDDFESWGLGYKVLQGDTKRPEVWEKFASEIMKEWRHPVYGPMKMARGFVDEGFLTEQVRKFCLSFLSRGIDLYPCKGIPRSGVTEPELVSRNARRKQSGTLAPTYNIGGTRAKRYVYGYLLQPTPGPKTMHFPEGNGYDDVYYQMLTAEKVKTRYSYGQPYKVFDLPSGHRNEALDIRCYNYAASVSLHPQWDQLRENLEERAKQRPKQEPHVSEKELQTLLTKEPEKEKDHRRMANPRRRTGRSGGGFVNNW